VWVNLGLAPGKKPDYSANYQNHQKYSGPNSGLEDIPNHLTATQGHSRKRQKYDVVRRMFHWYPRSRFFPLRYSSKGLVGIELRTQSLLTLINISIRERPSLGAHRQRFRKIKQRIKCSTLDFVIEKVFRISIRESYKEKSSAKIFRYTNERTFSR
jgi:hypothetical protein